MPRPVKSVYPNKETVEKAWPTTVYMLAVNEVKEFAKHGRLWKDVFPRLGESRAARGESSPRNRCFAMDRRFGSSLTSMC
jgi:hypothetical protein